MSRLVELTVPAATVALSVIVNAMPDCATLLNPLIRRTGVVDRVCAPSDVPTEGAATCALNVRPAGMLPPLPAVSSAVTFCALATGAFVVTAQVRPALDTGSGSLPTVVTFDTVKLVLPDPARLLTPFTAHVTVCVSACAVAPFGAPTRRATAARMRPAFIAIPSKWGVSSCQDKPAGARLRGMLVQI